MSDAPFPPGRRDMLALVRGALADRYTVERQVARGGAARVFLAHDRAGRAVALKVLHPELAVSITAERFLREISLLSRIDHPRISRLLDSGERDWLVYFAMTFVEGPTLREHIGQVRRASFDDTIRCACDVLDALSYAHGLGLVHRDVKPDNITLSPGGAVLMDFGIAKAVASSAPDRERLTRSGFTVGTSAYMSPEQVAGNKDIDQRSDLYSLGCVLFECLAGSPPYEAANDSLVLSLHLNSPVPEIEKYRRDVPERLAQLVARALAKTPGERWQTAAEMRTALRECRDSVRSC